MTTERDVFLRLKRDAAADVAHIKGGILDAKAQAAAMRLAYIMCRDLPALSRDELLTLALADAQSRLELVGKALAKLSISPENHHERDDIRFRTYQETKTRNCPPNRGSSSAFVGLPFASALAAAILFEISLLFNVWFRRCCAIGKTALH
jgi:hypothetical protein